MRRSWILQRGPASSWAEPGAVLLAWFGPGQEPGSPLTQRAGEQQILVSPAGEVWSNLSGSFVRLPVQKTASQLVCQIEADLSLILWRKPWWTPIEPEAFEGSGLRLVLPFQGWSEDIWYDGPLLAFAGRRVLAAVAAGPAGRLRIAAAGKDLSSDMVDLSWDGLFAELAKRRGQALKLSLLEALQRRAPASIKDRPTAAFELSIATWTAQTAALLLLLRASFPEAAFYLDSASPPPSPGWKRYTQNLDIQPQRRAQEASERGRLQLLDLWPADESSHFREFLLAYQKEVPLVPQHLLESL